VAKVLLPGPRIDRMKQATQLRPCLLDQNAHPLTSRTTGQYGLYIVMVGHLPFASTDDKKIAMGRRRFAIQ
jgi:hypothetical protein